MHPISDKELDKLFQQRFGELEIEPSEAVWGKITNEMDRQSTGKKSFSVTWMAAASVVIMISAGLWLYKPAEVIKLQGKSEIARIKTDGPQQIETILPENKVEKDQLEPAEFTQAKLAGNKPGDYQLIDKTPLVEFNAKTQAEKESPVIASNRVKKSSSSLQVKQEVKIPVRYSGDQSQLDVTQPDMIAKADITQELNGLDEPASNGQRKIRSIGSLVNFVIARVDKREDKIIEFRDGEEGSELSGINLGLIKLKSKK